MEKAGQMSNTTEMRLQLVRGKSYMVGVTQSSAKLVTINLFYRLFYYLFGFPLYVFLLVCYYGVKKSHKKTAIIYII